jgi:hypothetical protein
MDDLAGARTALARRAGAGVPVRSAIPDPLRR